MRKQFQKIKVAAENLRFNKPDKNSDELQNVEKQCDRYKEVLQALTKKFTPPSWSQAQATDPVMRDKRLKKLQEFALGQVMEDSCKELSDGLLKNVLENCGKLEKTIANELIDNEINVENEVSRKLNAIYDTHVTQLQKQKRIVTKCFQDNEAAKQKHQAAAHLQQQNPTKTIQLKDDQEECELKLEKERDIYASLMFELLAEEESISSYIINYIKYQKLCYKSALKEIEDMMVRMNDFMRKTNKKVFNISLHDHLESTGRKISYVIELCVCCLLEKGLYEEGLLRVGCAASKLKRMRSAIDASYISIPMPSEYQDCHVIAAVLKNYLRSLPEPLLTYRHYDDFLLAANKPNELSRKSAILNVIQQLPKGNYDNLKYLTKFLSLLAQKYQQNKMSSQNLAIVMSPNLLWPENEDDNNYLQQVHSTSAVNTIVDALIADWGFFFEGDVDFYITMTRDELFPDNGGFPVDKEQPSTYHNLPTPSKATNMSQSMNAALTNQLLVCGNNPLYENPSPRSHSRSSSHDTSLILYPDSVGDQPKHSQSNSSLSDQSSPVQGSSPKLPIRKKHNKPAAPVPPVDTPQKVVLTTQHSQKVQSVSYKQSDSQSHGLTFNEQNPIVDHGPQSNMGSQVVDRGNNNLFRAGSIDNLNSKSVKPPRPTNYAVDYHTIGRNTPKANKNESNKPDILIKPVALPRSVGTGPPPKPPPPNFDDENVVLLRDKEKPAIPDRPASLMRPPSFKGSVPEITKVDKCESTGGGGLKKTQSFRSDQKTAQQQEPPLANLGHTERTQMYNIDKKQVAIIDVIEHNRADKLTLDLSQQQQKLLEKENIGENHENNKNLSGSHPDLHLQQVPPSPRGFDPKVKRPQVPAPPPPILGNRPAGTAPTADSTNL